MNYQLLKQYANIHNSRLNIRSHLQLNGVRDPRGGNDRPYLGTRGTRESRGCSKPKKHIGDKGHKGGNIR